ncbi:5-formyltetrahydrofolate cyclo-ligase [Luteimonas sp. SHGZ20W]
MRQELRAELRERRRSLSPTERIRAANDVAASLLSLPFAPQSGYVAGYWSTDGELTLHAWLLGLPSNVIPCLPVLAPGKTLRFAPYFAGDPLQHNRFGIPEPVYSESSLLTAQDMQLVVTPLVGFDDEGNRLGMGGGFYDRTFAFRTAPDNAPPPPWLVGVGYDVQAVSVGTFNVEPWDVRPDAICTPTRQLLVRSTANSFSH